jgi:hypothetical protein
MPVSMEFLRGVLGLIGIACAYMLGRSIAAVRRGWQKPTRVYGWIIRAVLCLGAITIRFGIDTTALIIWLLAAVAFAVALWDASREKKQEDLTQTIFPEDQ